MTSTPTNFPMPITTPRLTLRPPTLSSSDIIEYVNAVTESIPEIGLWLPWAKYCPSLTQAEDYLRSCNSSWLNKNDNIIGLPVWIMDKERNKFIGNIVWEIHKFEFGYWLRTSQTNQGYITEAVNALTRYGLLQLGARRIEIRCEVKNVRAQRVTQRLGFELEGILRNSTTAVSDNKLTDVTIFSRIDLKNLPELNVNW